MRTARLTVRGVGMLVSGAAVILAGTAVGSAWLVSAGVFVVSLVGVALASARLRSMRTEARLVAGPAGLRMGQRFTATVTVVGQVPGRVRVAVRQLGWVAPRPAQDLRSAWRSPLGPRLEVSGTAAERGVHPWPRAEVRVADPYGIADSVTIAEGSGQVVVGPRLWPVRLPNWSAAAPSPAETEARRAGSGRSDGPLPRPFAPGDEVRHIHWPATARLGEPMVRSVEGEGERLCLVALDCRREAYSSPESFERAVSAAASIAVFLLRAGWRVGLRGAPELSRQVAFSAAEGLGEPALLRCMAQVAVTDRPGPIALGACGAAIVVAGRLPTCWGGPIVAAIATEPNPDRVPVWDGSGPLEVALRPRTVGV